HYLLAQGMFSRLIGSSSAFCTGTRESTGILHGLSLALSIILTSSSAYTRTSPRFFASYAYNLPQGITAYPFTTQLSINPLTYSMVSTSNAYRVGDTFASVLYEIYWNMIDAFGFSGDVVGNLGGSRKAGNTLMLDLLVTTAKYLPCNPTFLDARNAMLAANIFTYNSALTCILWKGMAKRGVGVAARAGSSENSFDLPRECT
ncbi:hypothetical protein HDU67_007581, partial [Dinochytrium kinnereticum]